MQQFRLKISLVFLLASYLHAAEDINKDAEKPTSQLKTEFPTSFQGTSTAVLISGTISTPGHYYLANNLTIGSGNGIVIDASNVVLNLDYRVITGTGGNNGIVVNSGTSNVLISNGIVQSMAQSGFDIQGDNCTVTNCDAISNTTGFKISSADTVVIDQCRALENAHNGFLLDGSSNCIVRDSTALNNGTTTGVGFGFTSSAGSNNIFESCVAQGTSTTASADTDIAAGFILRNNESSSSIINCVSNSTTTAAHDAANPFGIALEAIFEGTITRRTAKTFANSITRASVWNTDGSQFIVGGDNAGPVSGTVYNFNGKRLSVDMNEPDGTTVNSIALSREGSHVAFGGESGGTTGYSTRVYAIKNNVLEFIHGINFNTVNSVDWSYDGAYVATGDDNGDINIYSFNGNFLTLVTTESFGDVVKSVRWSLDNTLAVGGVTVSSIDIRIYSFDGSTLTLEDTANHGATVHSVDWSVDGTYLAIAGEDSSGSDTKVYSYDGANLTLLDSASHGATVRSVRWSPDARFLATAGDTEGTNSSEINLYSFASDTLTSLGFTVFGNNAYSISWAPHQRYLAVTGDMTETDPESENPIHNVRVFELELSGTSGCTVKDSLVTNTTGSFKSGIGISADSLNNHVVDNKSYNNDVNYRYTTNVYGQGLYGSPTLVQNIGIPPR